MPIHISVNGLKRDTEKIERTFNQPYEHQEAVIEEMRGRYRVLFEVQDDGDLPEEVADFIAAFQALEGQVR